jgi:hypothetical protein
MTVAMSERRAHERADGSWSRSIRAVLVPGQRIALVNISRGGALVDGSRPMRPGTRVMLQLTAPGAALGLSARVVRCLVRAVAAEGIVYRAALRFDERRDWTAELRRLVR